MFINVLSKRTREISHRSRVKKKTRKKERKSLEQSKNSQLNYQEAGRRANIRTHTHTAIRTQTLHIFGLKVAVDPQTGWQTLPTQGPVRGQGQTKLCRLAGVDHIFRQDID